MTPLQKRAAWSSAVLLTSAALALGEIAFDAEQGITRPTEETTSIEWVSLDSGAGRMVEETEVTEAETGTEEVTTEAPQTLGTFKLTAYCPCSKCCGAWAKNRPLDENGDPIVYTASSSIAKPGVTIAVDPSVIPLGSTVHIDGQAYIAEDTGGAIKGNRIDVYFSDHDAALAFGVQYAEISIN